MDRTMSTTPKITGVFFIQLHFCALFRYVKRLSGIIVMHIPITTTRIIKINKLWYHNHEKETQILKYFHNQKIFWEDEIFQDK